MMTPKQIELVQTSFRSVVPIKDHAATLFYQKLFELDPSLNTLFKSDMKEQGRKLMATLTIVVAGLNRLERLLPKVTALAERHVDYGVTEKDYDTVGVALLWTLEKGLGPAFTPTVRDAWTEAYMILSGAMIKAAREKPLKDDMMLLLAQAIDHLPHPSMGR